MEDKIVAVITGDVVASRSMDAVQWMPVLKQVLSELGRAPIDWDIYRGDAFQLLVEQPEQAFLMAMRIKAGFRSQKGLDIRMAIGIGTLETKTERVAESSGSAFISAGSLVDKLSGLNRTLGMSSPWPNFDQEMNVGMALASALMDRWLPNYAEAVAWYLREPNLTQKALGKKIGIAQNTLSERQTRAYRRELMDFEQLYRDRLAHYLGGINSAV